MMRNILLITTLLLMIFFIFTGCSTNKQEDTPEKAVNEIISCYNSGDIKCFWDRTLPQDRYNVSRNIISNYHNDDLFIIMSAALGVDNITSDNITMEEYLYGSFKIALGDKDLELINIEKQSDTLYTANLKAGVNTVIMNMKLYNRKWYMALQKP